MDWFQDTFYSAFSFIVLSQEAEVRCTDDKIWGRTVNKEKNHDFSLGSILI